MSLFIDQLGREVRLTQKPRRIVSVVPSQTELLFDLGLDQEIVGLTWFCIHPKKKVRDKEKVGGTKQLKLNKIAALQPDLVVANKEENLLADIQAMEKMCPIYISDVRNLDGALGMIKDLGEILEKEAKARKLVSQITRKFEQLVHSSKSLPKEALYLIWKEPYMSVGGDTFIHDMMSRYGYRNILADRTRYPELSLSEIQELNPPCVLLSSEPYPFKEKHQEELQQLLPTSQVSLVNGEQFSWYGSRLAK